MLEGKGRSKMKPKKEKPEFDQTILDLARVTRVTKGGKQLSFRACVVIGDRKGQVGYGLEKGKDVQMAVEKAVNQAKKNMIRVPMVNETVAHRVMAKFKAAKIMIKPAPRGSGVIAGGAVRTILEMAGVANASSKMLGKTNNKVTNVKATFKALEMFLPSAVDRARRGEAQAKERNAHKMIAPTPVVKKEEPVVEKKVAPKKSTPKAKKATA